MQHKHKDANDNKDIYENNVFIQFQTRFNISQLKNTPLKLLSIIYFFIILRRQYKKKHNTNKNWQPKTQVTRFVKCDYLGYIYKFWAALCFLTETKQATYRNRKVCIILNS